MTRWLVFTFATALLVSGLAAAGQPALQSDPVALQTQLRGYLFDAARHGDKALLSEFIEAGYDLDAQDAKGYSALILAAYNGHAPAVEQLLEAGADPCLEDARGNTALMGAIFKGELRIARRLLEADCSPDQRNAAGQTPAMFAALFQRLDILAELEAKGADLQARDPLGNDVESLAQGVIRTQ